MYQPCANVEYSAKVFGSHSHEGTDREVKICAMVCTMPVESLATGFLTHMVHSNPQKYNYIIKRRTAASPCAGGRFIFFGDSGNSEYNTMGSHGNPSEPRTHNTLHCKPNILLEGKLVGIAVWTIGGW